MTPPATAPRDEVALAVAAAGFQRAAQRLPTLFDLEDEAYRLLERLEENDAGDADIADLVLIDQMIVEKVESYVSVIRSLESMASARKAEADRLRDRARSAERQAEWLTQRLLVHLQTTGQRRLETSRFTVSVRTNPPSVNVLDASLVPAEFTRTKIVVDVDKRAVLDALKRDGLVVPGTEVTRSERLSIA